jgi:predicted metal-binding membrane protein
VGALAGDSSRRSLLVPVLGGLAALTWVALWMWQASPYGRFLRHDGLEGICSIDGAGLFSPYAWLYVAGWVLMIVAMMLPTTLPLLEIFRRMTARRANGLALLGLVVAGYLGVWLAFGIGAHVLDYGLNQGLVRTGAVQLSPWAFGAGTLFLAGAFQFSKLKYRCLDECRTPLAFVMERWTGESPRVQALRIGVEHGAFCVGCCWALMLLMFGVGAGSVGWMFALGAVMAVEKNAPWGRKLSAPLGVALIGWGAWVVAQNAWA